MMTITDRYGRSLDYLRVSVTDRCNLRCIYCMPAAGVPARPHAEILRLEEIARLVEAAAGMGLRKIRLTGGEPLVRKGIVSLVEMLASTPGILEVAMTTNGVLLETHAAALARAGLRRVNISLDTLRPERFRRITRLGDLDDVWRGIRAAEAPGLAPLKINAVIVRGVNDDELVDFATLTVDQPWHIRFIEVMPLAGELDWGPGLPLADERLITAAEMRQRLEKLGPLLPDPGPGGHGPARYYRLPGAQGTLGFISAMSDHFCASCNRLRLTADGWLRGCLFSDEGVAIKHALENGSSQAEIQAVIGEAIARKPERHPDAFEASVAGRAMSLIGG